MIEDRALRYKDSHGEGLYGSSRGSRTHNGQDYIYEAGEVVKASFSGRISKLGYCYRDGHGGVADGVDKSDYRYVEIEHNDGTFCRYMYCSPLVKLGDKVKRGTIIGKCQTLNPRYNGMTDHIHFEAFERKLDNGKPYNYLNPLEYLAGKL